MPLKVYSRKIQPPPESLHVLVIEPKKGTISSSNVLDDVDLPLAVSSSNILDDLDLPVAGKEKRQCTQHPLTYFVTLDNLSSPYRALISKLNSIEPPKTVQKALKDENWREAMMEEM